MPPLPTGTTAAPPPAAAGRPQASTGRRSAQRGVHRLSDLKLVIGNGAGTRFLPHPLYAMPVHIHREPMFPLVVAMKRFLFVGRPVLRALHLAGYSRAADRAPAAPNNQKPRTIRLSTYLCWAIWRLLVKGVPLLTPSEVTTQQQAEVQLYPPQSTKYKLVSSVR
jgi:hypothetical protein